jgi:GTPase SAR1 family protein
MELVHESDQDGLQTRGKRAIFIIGDTGVGKSHAVRQFITEETDGEKSLN